MVYDHSVICVLSLLSFFPLSAQMCYGQEANPTTVTSGNLQQQNTRIENHNNQYSSDSTSSITLQSVRKSEKKRVFKKTLSHTPVLDRSGNIYLASCDGKLSAIDPAGNTKWYIQLADKITTGFVISADNALYFSSGKTLYAIDLNGTLKWVFNADNTIDFPSVLDNQGNIYFVTQKDDYLYAIRLDGSLYWKAHINGHISTPPSITTDGSIYLATKDNRLYAINADGSLRWRRKIYCRQEEQLPTVTKSANIAGSNPILQSISKPVQESQEQTSLQTLQISRLKSEEIQTSSGETDKPTSTSFTASVVKGVPPLTVKFSDTSTGRVVNRCWDFGDGTLINSEQDPVHIYTTPGNYDVRLMVKQPDSTSTIIRRRYITVTDTFSNTGKEIMINKQEKKEDTPSVLTPGSNIYNDAKLSDTETLVSIANSKNP